jgi:uncharacterized damage-inducible protein DinB
VDTQSLINLAGGAALAALGWFARQVWDAVAELRKDVHQIEVELPSHYVRRDEFTEFAREIRDISKQIFDRISSLEQRKADR